jgi:microcystin-dependent protein
MDDQYFGEIRIFTGNFAPQGWALCNGQLMSISQNTALFSLLGTNYGGDGRTTFALPDLRDKAPLQAGHGNGLSPRDLGESGGEDVVTLSAAQMPSHTHAINCVSGAGDQNSPVGNVWAEAHVSLRGVPLYATGMGSGAPQMSPQAFAVAGGGQPHNNLPPTLTLNFIIALQGVFPPRS